ncbi:MAG: NAD-dependent epimerase/dehydratase family protein [Erysipelotrichaceae bacterium]
MFGVTYCILRICVPYGSLLNSDGNYGTYELFVNKAKKGENIMVYGDGEIYKTYTHIKDICELFYLTSSNEQCLNDVYNIGGTVVSLQQLANDIANKYGTRVVNVDWPDIDKAIDGGSTMMNSDKLDSILHYKYIKIKY